MKSFNIFPFVFAVSLPGTLEPHGSQASIQDQLSTISSAHLISIYSQTYVGDTYSGLSPNNVKTPKEGDENVCESNSNSAAAISQEEVLNFNLQTESSSDLPEVLDQPNTNVSVGDIQPETRNAPSELTNLPSATNHKSYPEDHSLHAIVPHKEDSAVLNLCTTNNSNETTNNDIDVLRIRLNSENHHLNRQAKRPISRSTVSVDRHFGAVPRNFGRRFGGSEDREIPPHPLNTYQWEDVRRSREKVIRMLICDCCVVCFNVFCFWGVYENNII